MATPVPWLFYYGASSNLSGGPRTVLNLLERLDRQAFDPVFVSTGDSLLAEEVRALGVTTVMAPLPSVLAVRDGKALTYAAVDKLRSLGALLAYNRRIAHIGRRCQIGGIWGRNAKTMLFVGMAARQLGVPLVWDIGMETESRGLMRLLHRVCLNLADVVVTQAPNQPAHIFGAALADTFDKKFVAIYPGIDDERSAALEQARRQARRSEYFRLLMIGTIHPRKNQLMLLHALPNLIARYPQIQVVFAGATGDSAYFQQLQDVVQTERLSSHVAFLGWRDDIPTLIGQSDMLVLCSHNEGVPHVVREAMWAGLPVIATAVGGVPDVIQPNQTGFLVEPDDTLQLQRLIEFCLLHPEIRRVIANNARRFAQQRFVVAAWADAYNSLLRRLCTAPSSNVDLSVMR